MSDHFGQDVARSSAADRRLNNVSTVKPYSSENGKILPVTLNTQESVYYDAYEDPSAAVKSQQPIRNSGSKMPVVNSSTDSSQSFYGAVEAYSDSAAASFRDERSDVSSSAAVSSQKILHHNGNGLHDSRSVDTNRIEPDRSTPSTAKFRGGNSVIASEAPLPAAESRKETTENDAPSDFTNLGDSRHSSDKPTAPSVANDEHNHSTNVAGQVAASHDSNRWSDSDAPPAVYTASQQPTNFTIGQSTVTLNDNGETAANDDRNGLSVSDNNKNRDFLGRSADASAAITPTNFSASDDNLRGNTSSAVYYGERTENTRSAENFPTTAKKQEQKQSADETRPNSERSKPSNSESKNGSENSLDRSAGGDSAGAPSSAESNDKPTTHDDSTSAADKDRDPMTGRTALEEFLAKKEAKQNPSSEAEQRKTLKNERSADARLASDADKTDHSFERSGPASRDVATSSSSSTGESDNKSFPVEKQTTTTFTDSLPSNTDQQKLNGAPAADRDTHEESTQSALVNDSNEPAGKLVTRIDSVNAPAKLPSYQMRGNGWELFQYNGVWLVDYHVKAADALPTYPLDRAANASFIVNSYPRSGTTWLKAALAAMFSSDPQDALKTSVHRLIPCMEDEGETIGSIRPWRMIQTPECTAEVCHTHFPMRLWPAQFFAANVAVIYIYRNAKDCALSNYHFMHGIKVGKPETYTATINEYVDEITAGKTWYGPYVHHIADAIKYGQSRLGNRFLLLNYDEAMQNQRLALKTIRNFVIRMMGLERHGSDKDLTKADYKHHVNLPHHSSHTFSLPHLHLHHHKNRRSSGSGTDQLSELKTPPGLLIHSVDHVLPIISFDSMAASEANQLTSEPEVWDSSKGKFIRRAVLGGWRDELSAQNGMKLDEYVQEAAPFCGLPEDIARKL